MSDITKLHEELMQNPEYRDEYEATRESFELQRDLIRMRQVDAFTVSKKNPLINPLYFYFLEY